MLLHALRRCQRGTTVIEFAIVAPALIMMMFGLIESSRMMWVKQTMQEVAQTTARCMTVNASCSSNSSAKAFAQARATSLGISVTAANITTSSDATCKGYANSKSVSVKTNFDSPLVGFVPAMSGELTATACFPTLTNI